MSSIQKCPSFSVSSKRGSIAQRHKVSKHSPAFCNHMLRPRETQLPADHVSLRLRPVVVTDGTPLIVVIDLDTPLPLVVSAHQLDWVGINWGVCRGNTSIKTPIPSFPDSGSQTQGFITPVPSFPDSSFFFFSLPSPPPSSSSPFPPFLPPSLRL